MSPPPVAAGGGPAFEWLARARAAADAEAAAPRLPLLSGESASAFGSIEPALAERLAAAGLPLGRGEGGWSVGPPLDAGLAEIARWLHRAGVCSHWRGELLAVRDSEGAPAGVVERSVVRALGIPTAAAHLVGTTPDGRVWVQQRAFAKATDPGAWDTLVGGLVGAGETIATALARETREEAGCELADLGPHRFVDSIRVRRPVPDGWMDEAIAIFHAVVPDRLTPVNRDGEVERFECLPPGPLLDRLAAGAFTLEATVILGRLVENGLIATR